jgi:2-C-methyl-D-erythritol 4-phosphate cytidylyltransferase / 2-C-methyl-D-erythritol 2,4-cyclodiphosphate synthase
MRIAGIVVAAGQGARVGGETPKQYSMLAGRPVIDWSLRALAAAEISPLVAVIAPEHAELFARATGNGKPIIRAFGGATRTASVRAGLEALTGQEVDAVMIHDAARPGLGPGLVRSLTDALAAGADGAAPALPLVDALRRADGEGWAGEEVARAGLVRVQTPQAFRMSVITAAYHRLPLDAVRDDDIAVAEAAGARVRFVAGDPRLAKLTYPEDFAMLERELRAARTPCVGTGFDAHRFGSGDHVMLCGVRIAHHKGLIGHSDADAGWHALVDAILGALGEGDIGAHFPPSEAAWKGASSELFLRRAAALAEEAGARILHVDVTLICERPKIGPHREAMRARTAEVLGLPISRVSIKATTTEQLGFLGREEGLAAQAAATVERVI